MTGTITKTHLAHYPFSTVGGAIRCPELPERVPFVAAELVPPLSMQTELLGKTVVFDLLQGAAVRIRLAKA